MEDIIEIQELDPEFIEFTVAEALDDGHKYVRVSNKKGEHLFCAGSRESAECRLTQDHNRDVAACWRNPILAPKIKINFIPLED